MGNQPGVQSAFDDERPSGLLAKWEKRLAVGKDPALPVFPKRDKPAAVATRHQPPYPRHPKTMYNVGYQLSDGGTVVDMPGHRGRYLPKGLETLVLTIPYHSEECIDEISLLEQPQRWIIRFRWPMSSLSQRNALWLFWPRPLPALVVVDLSTSTEGRPLRLHGDVLSTLLHVLGLYTVTRTHKSKGTVVKFVTKPEPQTLETIAWLKRYHQPQWCTIQTMLLCESQDEADRAVANKQTRTLRLGQVEWMKQEDHMRDVTAAAEAQQKICSG